MLAWFEEENTCLKVSRVIQMEFQKKLFEVVSYCPNVLKQQQIRQLWYDSAYIQGLKFRVLVNIKVLCSVSPEICNVSGVKDIFKPGN